jgi:hypothetical protein
MGNAGLILKINLGALKMIKPVKLDKIVDKLITASLIYLMLFLIVFVSIHIDDMFNLQNNIKVFINLTDNINNK